MDENSWHLYFLSQTKFVPWVRRSEGPGLLRRLKQGIASSPEPQLCPLGELGGRGVPPATNASGESAGVVQLVAMLDRCREAQLSSSHWNPHCIETSVCGVSSGRDIVRMCSSCQLSWPEVGIALEKSTGEQKLWLPVIVLPFLFHTSVSINFP